MHYTGNSEKFLNLHKKFKKAIEFYATVESLAYTISKTKNINSENQIRKKFNQTCEKLSSDKYLRDIAIEDYIKNEIDYLDSNEKYLLALHKASDLAIKIDTSDISKTEKS